MTKKLRLILIALLAVIACTCLFAGCTLKPSLGDVLGDLSDKGAIVDVTYFANEGNFNGGTGGANNSGSTYTNEADDGHDHDYSDGACKHCGKYPNEADDGHEHNYKDGPCIYCGKYQNKEDDGHTHSYKGDVCIYCGKGRTFSNKSKVRTLRLAVGSRAIEIGKATFESGSINVAAADITRFELAGWYKAELDSKGNPVYEDGSSYIFEYDTQSYDVTKKIKYNENEPFDFSTKLEKGTHYYLVAVWRKIQTVQVVLAGEASSIKVQPMNGKETTYKSGDVINNISYESNGIIPQQLDALSGSTVLDATFVEFYHDAACEQIFKDEDWPIYLSDHVDDDPENPYTIYAKYIEGNDWTVVKDISGVTSMFSGANSSSNRFYLVKDINCNDNLTINARVAESGVSVGYGCEIRGNGCKISNFKVIGELSLNTGCASFFGDIKASAKISNIIFENVTQEYTVNEKAYVNKGIFFAFASIAEGAKVEGVEFVGNCTMKVTIADNAYVNNLVNGMETTNWKFGSYDNDSDYIGGITVTDDATLKIN